MEGDDEKITQKGFIRNQTENSIGYKTFVISDSSTSGNGETKLKLPNKTCYLKKENVMISRKFEDDEKSEIENFIKNETEQIPADEFMFKIWQFEYIEKGLREY